MEFKNAKHTDRTSLYLAIACVVLQAALTPQISLGGGTVNFMAILAVATALREPPTRAVVTGFCAGLFFDLTTAAPVGLMALLMTVLAFIVNQSYGMRGSMSPSTQYTVGAVAVVALNLVFGLLLFFMGVQTDILVALFGHGLWTGIFTALVQIPFLAFAGVPAPSYGFSGASAGKRFKSKSLK